MEPSAHRPMQDRQGMADLLVRLVGDMGHLVSQHVALAKLELQDNARRAGKGVAQIAAFAPLLLVGYSFLNAALALAIARWMSVAAAVALVGVLNLLAGLVGVLTAARALRRPLLDDSVQELEKTALALAPGRPAALEVRHDG